MIVHLVPNAVRSILLYIGVIFRETAAILLMTLLNSLLIQFNATFAFSKTTTAQLPYQCWS